MTNPPVLDRQARGGRAGERRALRPPPLLFIGGSGRSGTHVVAKILNRHSHFHKVPNEARFHTDPGGFPDVLAGRTSPDLFVYRLERHWWRNFEPARLSFRGIHRYVPRERLEAATGDFLRRFGDDPQDACRRLFWELLGPLATAAGKAALIEQTCDVVAEAPTLGPLFPDARFLHVVRDGRDAAASRVGQGGRLVHPRTIAQGLEWWDARIRRIDEGVRSLEPGRVGWISLEELVHMRRRRTFRLLRRFAGIRNEDPMRSYFQQRVRPRNANRERWREAVADRSQADVDARYREILERIEEDGIHCAPMLRRVYEWRRS